MMDDLPEALRARAPDRGGRMMAGLVERLRDGLIERQKRWSGDTHDDLGGSVDYDATDALMDEAADCIEALEAENAALREAAVRLIARLSEYEADNLTDQSARDWFGHVEPAIATCRAAITKTEGEG